MAPMRGLRNLRRVGVIATLLALGIPWNPLGAAPPTVAGRPVANVLQDLQDPSLRFLFSTDLVPDSLVTTVEPHGRDRLGIAREVLAEHGLTLRSVNPTLYIVIRAREEPLHQVSGRVLHAHSSEPVRGARVELLPLGRVTWSDSTGRFKFGRVSAGIGYRLVASIDDHARGEAAVHLDQASRLVESTIRLQPVALDTVVVETSRYELEADEAGAMHLDGARLTQNPDVAEDPLRALRRLPGVVQNGLSAASNLRGGEIGDVLVLLDGFVLRQVYHLNGYQSPFSVLDEGSVGSIDVFTGGFPARYGNRLAGVFDISSRRASESLTSSVGVSFVNAHGRLAGVTSDSRSEWQATARIGTLRPLLQTLSVDAGRPSYGDLSLSGTHRVNDRVRMQGQFLGAADEYRVVDDDERAEIGSRSRYAWVRADFEPIDALTGTLMLGHSRLDSDRIGFVDKPEFAISEVVDARRAEYWDLRGDLNWHWSERNRLNAGFEWIRGKADFRYDGSARFAEPLAELFGVDPVVDRQLQAAPTQRRAAFYLSHRWRLHDSWVPELGVRMQDFTVDGLRHRRTWDPRLGLRWEMRPRTTLRAHWGRFHQADEVHEMQAADGATQIGPIQRADHLIAGVEHAFTNGVQLRLEAYRKTQPAPRVRFENLLSPLEVFAELAPDRVRVAADDADIRGVELSIALERESWNAWGSVSLSRAEERFGNLVVPRSWDERQAVAGGIDWRRGNWRAGAAAALRGGWPTTPVWLNEDGEATLGPRNSRRLPRFMTLDARVEYRRPIAVGSVAITLEVTNLTNRRNQCCSDVEVEEGTMEAIEVEAQYWPRLLPSIGIKWEH